MSWSRMSPLAISREHTHEAHVRWIAKSLTPRYAAIIARNDEAHRRTEEAVGPQTRKNERHYHDTFLVFNAQVLAEAGLDPGNDHIENQCGGCVFYVPLDGSLGSDWGACTNPAAPWDGTLKFEHDGCEHYGHDDLPLGPEYREYLETAARCAEGILDDFDRGELE